MLQKFWKWLTATARRELRKAHPDLHPIDVDKLAEELGLAREAARLGLAGLPSPDSVSISGPEAAIVQRVEKARQDYVDWAVMRLSVLNQNIARRDVTRDVQNAREAGHSFERKASRVLDEHNAILNNLADDRRSINAELAEFRETNGLKRNARYPSSGRAFFLYGVLAALVVIEGALNAMFFSQGMDTGLVGGFLMAAALASANVAVAFLLGKFPIRFLGHVKLSWKLFGATAAAFAISCMLLMGLGIAHYRDALTNDAAVPAQAALATLLNEPLHLRDVFSWPLFAISVIFATLSIFDGLYSDDLYPGYGAIARRAAEVEDDYEDELASVREELEELKDEELATLEKTMQRVQSGSTDFGSLIEDKRSARSRLSTALRDADHSLEALLRKFRTENELHRDGKARPVYFDRLPALSPLQLPDFDTAEDELALATQKELIESLLLDVEQIRAQIQGAFNQKFDSVRPLDDHFMDRKAA